jgi:prepilin-type processing-associated H-X9-DG protein
MIELVVVMAILTLLIALAMPAIGRARLAARRSQCQNNLRNIGLAMLQATELADRFPAAGNFAKNPNGQGSRSHHSWVIDVLPWLDQSNISSLWDKDKPIWDPVNQPLTQHHLAVLVCPDDISANGRRAPFNVEKGDLSYVVNGGAAFTIQYFTGVHDCPVAPNWQLIDFNGNGIVCPDNPADDGTPSDKDFFFRMGLFFLETWKWDVTIHHHRFGDVTDGMSNTIMLSENTRTGFDPAKPGQSWADPSPFLVSFYIGNPCNNNDCSDGFVDYSLANSGRAAINAGLSAAEGTSPYPSSFHDGGVNFVFGDGRVKFISQNINGMVYAALCSPQGSRLDGTPLAQGALSDAGY